MTHTIMVMCWEEKNFNKTFDFINNIHCTIFHFNTTSLQSVKIGLVMVGTYIKMKYITAN